MRPIIHLTIPQSVPALALAAASFLNCAVPCDQVDPTDPACMRQSANLSLLTNRLPKSGGRLSAQVKDLESGDRVTATLGSGGPVVNFTMNADGSGSAELTGALLSNIPLGALNVTLQVETQQNVVRKSLTKTLHIYALPSYSDSVKASTSTSGIQPTWVQISLGHVFSTLDNGTAKRIFEYQVVGPQLQAQPSRWTHTNTVPSSVTLDISETQTIKLTPTGTSTTYYLDAANLNSSDPQYSNLMELTLSKTNGLAVDKLNKLVAVAGEGMDGPLKAFTMPQSSQTSMPITVSGIPLGKSPVLVGWGDLNGDKLLDLVAVHADNSFGVYLQQAGQGLAYDQTWSSGLGNAAALQGATPPAFAIGDADRDGLDDVLIGQNKVISHLASEGDGTFSKTPLLSSLPVDALGLGDVNGDGKLDLALVQKSRYMIICYTNQSP